MSNTATKTFESKITFRDSLGKFLRTYGSYATLVLLVFAASLLSENFWTTSNIFLVLRQTAALGIVAIGQTFVILTAGVDLSVTSIVSLAVVLFTGLYDYNDANLPMLLTVTLSIAVITGLINGYVISRLKIPPIVMTLGTQTLVLGGGLMFTKGVPLNTLTDNFRFIGLGMVANVIPAPVIVWAAVTVVAIIILYFTNYGRYVFAASGFPPTA